MTISKNTLINSVSIWQIQLFEGCSCYSSAGNHDRSFHVIKGDGLPSVNCMFQKTPHEELWSHQTQKPQRERYVSSNTAYLKRVWTFVVKSSLTFPHFPRCSYMWQHGFKRETPKFCIKRCTEPQTLNSFPFYQGNVDSDI